VFFGRNPGSATVVLYKNTRPTKANTYVIQVPIAMTDADWGNEALLAITEKDINDNIPKIIAHMIGDR
jgi:hypothetical protein